MLAERYNFAASIFETNRARGEKTAYVDDRGTLTYAELEQRSRAFATMLGELGVRREERVVLFMLDTVELPIAFLGSLFAGVVPVLVNTMVPAADLAFYVEHSRAQAIFASTALAGTWKQLRDAPRVIDDESLATRLAALAPSSAPADTYADDIAFWLYSSGSTGKPKAVVHTHANIHHTVELYGTPVMGVREDDTIFSAAKIFFAYGLGNALTFPLAVGARVVLMAGRATPDAIFERLRKHRATIFCGAPTTYVAMLASPALPKRDDVALRVCTSAGEALPAEVGKRFEAHFGAPILDGIGSTEMLHIYLSNRLGDVAYGTSGRPVEGYELDLRDADAEGIGDLWVKGPSAALLYWRDRARTNATFVGPWMKTGDKYVRLASGHWQYAGRSDDMLKVSGQYVSPVEVEVTLQTHEAVLEAAVVGRVDANGLTTTCAFVVLRSGRDPHDALAAELKAHVKSKLAPHKYPREILFVSELPKTATGKLQRFRLRSS
ncbi:MAG TPA: benzoate-CoA ligase family protein [Labilithrix sp.]